MTSEERLLNLIRKKKPSGDSGGDQGRGDPNASQVGLQEGGIAFLNHFNRILVVLCVGLLAYIGVNYSQLDEGRGILPIKKFKVEKDAFAEEIALLSRSRSFDVYQEAIEERDVFQLPWEKPVDSVSEGPGDFAPDFTNRLKLVGIMLDKDPKAIIEDKKINQTLFLSVGDKINGAAVLEIQENKVILDFDGQKIELGR